MRARQKIVQDPNPVLREVAQEFDFSDPIGDRATLSNRLSILLPLSGGYAIAAPQIGISKAAFIYNVEGQRGVVFNPSIIDYSDELWTFREGCLSIAGKFWDIERPRRIKAVGYNSRGEEKTYELTDLLARVFQHEIDHLLGILVRDHVHGE